MPARATEAARPRAPAPDVPASLDTRAEALRAAAEEEVRRRAVARARRPADPETPAAEPPPPPRGQVQVPAGPPLASAVPAAPAAPPGPGDLPSPGAAEPGPPPELAAGSLDDTSPARLLALAARARLRGRLDFSGAAPRSIYFDDGRVVGATSGAPGERVEEVALRLGLLTREQHRQASPACAGLPTRRAALVLLERGFLKPEELTRLVRRRTEEVLFALFSEAGGSWRHALAPAPADERTALDRSSLALAVEGVRRRWQEDRIERTLGGPSTLLAPAASPPRREDLGLGGAESRLLGLADGLRTLDEIAADSPLDALSTRQLLAGLVEVGALEVRIRAGPAAAVAPAQDMDLARLAEKLDQVRRADYFTILGLSRTATPFEIGASFERLLRDLAPERWSGVADPGLPERLAEVRRVVTEAAEVLSDEGLRSAYLEGLG